MFFDDRLATVLRQNAQSDALRRTQYRQLLDLLGAQANGAREAARDPSLVAAAWMRMDKLAQNIPARDRARLIEEPSWRLRNPELAAHLADFEPEVASAALSRAQLSSDDWTALIPRLPVRARGFLRLRKDLGADVEAVLERLGVHDRGLPHPEAQPAEATSQRHASVQDQAAINGRDADHEKVASLSRPDIGSHGLPSVGPDKEEGAGEDETPAPSRPIFFPQDRGQRRDNGNNETGPDTSPLTFTPRPFTREELREIAEEPLGEKTPDEPEDVFELDDEAQDPVKSHADTPPPRPKDVTGAPKNEGRSEISALVDRIAQFKRNREEANEAPRADETPPGDGDALMPRLPLGEEDRAGARVVRGFAFAADAAGRIEWAESEVAPMVVGTRLIARSRLQSGGTTDAMTRAFYARQIIKAAPLSLNGAPMIAGDWVVDAQPRFSAIGGFSGYIGRMRRKLEVASDPEPSPAQQEADRIRQLLHELRTPVTAVQGYSEVIQQQLFGSAPHEYRALAAAIASDAARILSGFEELDRLAKLETGVIELEQGASDISGLAKRIIRQLAQVLDARMAGVELVEESDTALIAAIDGDSAESLMWRMLATLGGGCGAGETLQAKLSKSGGMVQLTCDLPMQLLGEDDLFAADARPISTAINPGLFGAGFALRLARAEARSGGGDLTRKEGALTLSLPLGDARMSETTAEEPK
ncbi:hypothetical protein MWU38_13070 [Qipengyuania sp. S6317L1]|uniref:histidine kinase dimerization/phospho-acceptor domain-containing protein n=1 Tax=Qipengyuania sp. S6317L1 TaxID=2926410 RepID=UPI001FF33F93|nr:histidine kinase dimerization/phospho-acceptor domain-containing protein [Qipengyuania sp. S6317L1]MCK0100316.1 hypothetical protein [Qipengyuania sp. S6317L1]